MIKNNSVLTNQVNRSTSVDKPPMSVLKLGTIDLSEAAMLMKHFINLRADDKIPDLLLILSHQPVLSVGARKFNANDLFKPISYFVEKGIDLFKSTRGGGLTFFWPGQLVVYPILKLRKEEQHLSKYMYNLEEVGLRTLNDLGIRAERKRDKTAQIGLWYSDKKIASMGIYVSNWVTSHGFALNLGGDLSPSGLIRPCGLDVKLTTVAEIKGHEPDKKKAIDLVIKHFREIFNRTEKIFFLKMNEELEMNLKIV